MLVAQYKPRGNTPLYDALGEMIEGVQQKDQPVLLVTITDGQENASRKYDKLKIQSLRAEKEKNGWTFVFLGADLDAYEEASKVGYAAANVASYAKGAEAYMAQNLVASTMAYSETRSASLKSALAAGSSLTASLYNQERGEKFFDDADREKMLDKTKTPRKKK
jgi:Mg-chelatase subunit ChlD